MKDGCAGSLQEPGCLNKMLMLGADPSCASNEFLHCEELDGV